MASKVCAATALLLTLNLLFLGLVSATGYVPCPPPPYKPPVIKPPPFKPPPIEPPPYKPPTFKPPPIEPPPCGSCTPVKPPPIEPPPYKPPPIEPPPCGSCPPVYPSCPRDTLKLGVCADVLSALKLKVGTPPKDPCCSVLEGLADLEAAVCLCTAIKANILGNNLDIPVDLSLLLNYCGKNVPSGFKCA